MRLAICKRYARTQAGQGINIVKAVTTAFFSVVLLCAKSQNSRLLTTESLNSV